VTVQKTRPEASKQRGKEKGWLRRWRWIVFSVAVVILAVALAAYFFRPYWFPSAWTFARHLQGAGQSSREAQPVDSGDAAGSKGQEGQSEEAKDGAQGAEKSQETSGQATENVYAAPASGKIKDSLADVPERVYVPNVGDGTISVIDPSTFKVVDSYSVGKLPYHITPSWDMSKLYVDNEESSTFTIIDPGSGRPDGSVSATYPYNFYYTPDGSKAIVVAERLQRMEFRDPKTWDLLGSVYIPSPGVDHLDFSADGSYLLASSEWGGVVSKIDVNAMQIVGYANVGGLPIDVKLSPDGSVFYVANQGRMGVSAVDPKTMKEIDFIPTGRGAHGLQVSRDTKSLYVTNRLEGTISVIDFATRKVTDTWTTGGTPDMMQLSPDGKQLWVSGRYDGVVYVLDTVTGKLLSTIHTGKEPHGLTYFPNSGRFSLGHNGVYR
jgi:YVTN family beta-propeller protein